MIPSRISIRKHLQQSHGSLWVYLLVVAWVIFFVILYFLTFPHFKPFLVRAQTQANTSTDIDLNQWYEVTSPEAESYWTVDSHNSAYAYIDRGVRQAMLVPHTSAWDPSWKNYELSFTVTHSEGVDLNFLFHYVDSQNWYEFHIKYGSYQLLRVEDGRVTFHVSEEISIPQNTPTQVIIKVVDDLYELYLNDQRVASHQDWTHNEITSGSIGLRATTGAIFPTRVKFENINFKVLPSQISNPNPASTPNPVSPTSHPQSYLPHFKQNDPLWAPAVYNHADQWAEKITMADWGCLTTSMAMVLRFYGIDKVPVNGAFDPTGPELNPKSLNEWLKSQPDGYLGDGLFNWIAATRLTHIVSQALGTPKLEYSFSSGSDLNPAYAQFAQNRPVIFNVPGHFVVGSPEGWSADSPTNIAVHDPFYTYSELAQYGAIRENQSPHLLSTRILTPSQTDLSYLVIVHSPYLKLKIIETSTHSEIPLLQTHDWIATPEHANVFNPQKIIAVDTQFNHQKNVTSMVAKPHKGTYTLLIEAAYPQKYEIKIFTYNEQADLVDFSQDTWITKQPLKIGITTDPQHRNNEDKLHTTFSIAFKIQDFQAELDSILSLNPPFIIVTLVHQLKLIFSQSLLSEPIQLQLAQQLLNLYKICISPEITDYFSNRLTLLSNLLEISEDS